MMKILHILDHSIPLHSGYTFRTRAILEQQRARGWETAHVTSAKHTQAAKCDAAYEEVDGFGFYRTSLSRGWLAGIPVLNQFSIIDGLAARLADIIPEVRPDVLHAHSPALDGVAALRAARRFDLPLVYEVRAFWEDAAVDHGTAREGGMRYRATRALETYVLKRADAVTCICEGLRGDIIARGIPAAKVSVIPNAVDAEKFALGGTPDAALAASLGLSGSRVLGFIGSFYAYEGLTLLLQALPQMLEKAPDVRVLLVGGGPQEQELKRLAQELKLEGKIVFTGRVPHHDVPRYYDLIDILVYPRLPMRLTELVTPLKPLEAMAQGRLILASDVGGHKELIRQGSTGQLFRAGDAAALAQAALQMLAQRERWSEFKAAARAYVEQERNWPVSVTRYTDIYQRLVGAS